MANVPAKRTKQTMVRFTPEQYRLVEQRAQKCGLQVAVWMRSILLQAAKRQGEQGFIRIREPDGRLT
jgi:hypothetical protein